MLHRLLYISQGDTPVQQQMNIERVLDAGVKFIQLRMKDAGDSTFAEAAEPAMAACEKYKAMLAINDNVEVAQKVGAAAVHLGLEDESPVEARLKLPGRIIGGTANTFEDVQRRCNEKVDYIGLGPFRFTATKKKLSPVLGISGYTRILNEMTGKELHVPVFAIGGIEAGDVRGLRKAGVHGIAVSGILTGKKNTEEIVKELNKLLNNAEDR